MPAGSVAPRSAGAGARAGPRVFRRARQLGAGCAAPSRSPGETKIVEVSHEALIREWPTLCDWLNQDREGLIRHRQLTADVNDWLNLGKDSGSLYRGARLQQALGWTAAPPDPLSVVELEFLEASRAAAEEEARRAERLAKSTRNQRLLLGIAALLLIGVIVAVLNGMGVFNPPPGTMIGDFNLSLIHI